MNALQRAQARLNKWQDEEARLSRKIGDAHNLSPEMRDKLWEDLERAQRRIRFYEAAVEAEETKLEIREWKKEAAK